MPVESCISRLSTVLFLPPPRERNQRHVLAPRLTANVTADVMPAQAWQPDVEENNVRAVGFDCIDGGEAIMCGERFVPAELQQHREGICGVAVVINHENPTRLSC